MKHLGRKLYHVIGGLGLLSLYFLVGRGPALSFYALLLLAIILFETARLTIRPFNDYLFSHFGSFLRQSEVKRITGTGPYVLGIGLALFLYRSDIAAAAVSFLAVGDVAATTVGERYGKTKIVGAKSLEGSAAFAAAALLAGVVLMLAGLPLSLGVVVAGVLTAVIVELVPVPVNDNLLIPLISGGIMELVSRAQP